MPGRLIRLDPEAAVGWASHARLPDYRVVVNMVHGATIARSVLAQVPLLASQTGGVAVAGGFRIDLAPLALTAPQLGKLQFWIGETDERLAMPEGWVAPAGRLTVEDLLARSHRARPWITGTTYLDAELAGLGVDDIIDLLYRDFLGRPSDPHGLTHYGASIRSGAQTYDDIRRGFIDSDEFRMRRKYLDRAPGAIFSQKILLAAGVSEAGPIAARPGTGQTVVASELAALDGEEFVAEVYRRVLLKEADEGGMAHYLHQLHLGVTKLEIIRTIADELEAITAGVHVVGYETAAPREETP